jgi:hypothetical protein
MSERITIPEGYKYKSSFRPEKSEPFRGDKILPHPLVFTMYCN